MGPHSPAVSAGVSGPPKVWSNFKFKKKDIFDAMSSTPGWI